MDSTEYLAFVPLLLYGIALADLFDLLGQWRRFFDKEYLYWPYFLTTVMVTELAIRTCFSISRSCANSTGSAISTIGWSWRSP